MAIKKTIDKRTLLARSLLLDALFELMEEMDFSAINIKLLTEKAGVSRQTFYRNYETIDDILVEATDVSLDTFYTLIEIDLIKGSYGRVIDIAVEYTAKNRIHLILAKAPPSAKIMECYIAYAMRIKRIASKVNSFSPESMLASYFFAGGVYLLFNKAAEAAIGAPTAKSKQLMIDSLDFLVTH